MKRRGLFGLPSLAVALALGGCASRAGAAQPSYRISAEQLEKVLAERFPMRHSVQGLLNLDLHAPRLRLLPQLNRVGSEFAVDAAGPALRRRYNGLFDLDFALRYEPSDQSIRAHQLRVHALRFSGLPEGASEVLDTYGPAIAEHALQEVVLHRLRPRDLALADAMGLQPGSITVAADGLVIGFVAKSR